MEEAQKMQYHKVSRGHVRGRVTRLVTDIGSNLQSYSKSKILQNLAVLKECSKKLSSLDECILQGVWASVRSDAENVAAQQQELDSIAGYEDTVSEAVSKLEQALAEQSDVQRQQQSVPSAVAQAVNTPGFPRVKAEKIPLPTYGGESTESFEKFVSSFEAITAHQNYTDYEKFLLLKKNVQGRAAVLLNSLEYCKQTYNEAKSLLEKAFASPIVQKYNTLERLLKLKLLDNKDPLFIVSEMRQITEMVHSLKIDVDLILQFFYWRSLPADLQEHLVHITNSAKPSLKDIEDNVFAAIERTELDKSSKSVVKTKNLALKVDYESKNNKIPEVCTLCSGEHRYFRCNKYVSAADKIRRLRDIKGCHKCGHNNHKTADCRMNVVCVRCNGQHFPSLCVKADAKKEKTKSVKTVNNSMVLCLDKYSDGIVLPTFTCRVGNRVVRVLKDTGAQATLVEQDLADSLNCKVKNADVPVDISGFNSTRKIISKIVELPVKLGDRVFLLDALCVPKIDIDLKLPGLGNVVDHLQNLGYDLADKLLSSQSNSIADIKIVLGVTSSFCIPVSSELFGKDNRSVLLNTPYGTMIQGDAGLLAGDLNSLSSRSLVPMHFTQSNVSLKRSDYHLISEDGSVTDREVERATQELMQSLYDSTDYDKDDTGISNSELAAFVLNSSDRLSCGRLVLPLMWNSKVHHLLGTNENLARQILLSNLKKLSKDENKLCLTNDVFKDQVSNGIIEPIENFEEFKIDNPNYSFLPHMSIFKLDKQTTKCRIVNLSNMCEKNPALPSTITHNQAICSGPNLNPKLSSALTLWKFDQFVLTYDLVKAFLMLAVPEVDQSRLLVMWFKDVTKKDFSLVYYKFKRLPFGISCAPSLLMLALYKILVLDDEGENELTDVKQLAYSLLYMDNGAITGNDPEFLRKAKDILVKVFGNYRFKLQQFVTNDAALQVELDREAGTVTPDVVRLFGMNWNRIDDTLATDPIKLDCEANTKRTILKSYAENFDILGYNCPIMNRAKLFVHSLQCNKSLGWETKISVSEQKEWRLICHQANSSPVAEIPRYVGDRQSKYRLVAFTDASKVLYGNVVYLQDLNTGSVSFLAAKNKVVGSTLAGKSIPTLELIALEFGVETLFDIREQLSGEKLLNPIVVSELQVYCDSMVALSWLDGITNKLDKSQNKLSVIVRNRLSKIIKLCEAMPVTFLYITGEENPADKVTRAISKKLLDKSKYYTGPDFLKADSTLPNVCKVTIPCPRFVFNHSAIRVNAEREEPIHLIPLSRYSSFAKYVGVLGVVIKFVNKLKCKVRNVQSGISDSEYMKLARSHLIVVDQRLHFPDAVKVLSTDNCKISDLPNIVKQLGVYLDAAGILRVRGKFGKTLPDYESPVLLSKCSELANLIIGDIHVGMSHSGKYAVLAELRKYFYIPKCFSKVKMVLKNCTHCRRFNSKTVQLNQSDYRLNRLAPSEIPYRNLYLDHFGSFLVKFNGIKEKVYILLITCMFTRAFNLQICRDMTVASFLRAFQMHVHCYGMPSEVTSDSGSSLIAGGHVVKDFLKDEECVRYLSSKDVTHVEFTQFCKGKSALGGLVESGVKLCKRLIFGSVKNNCLDYEEFEFLISEVTSLVNKRPIAFKEAAREDEVSPCVTAITPEMLIHGYSLPSLNVIPGLQPIPDDPDYVPYSNSSIVDRFDKLRKVRSAMLQLYREEFLTNLLSQSVDRKDRYKPVLHRSVSPGDIVLLKENFTKAVDFPLAIVQSVFTNNLGEVTSAKVKKGCTNEIVTRHSSTIIPFYSPPANAVNADSNDKCPSPTSSPPVRRSKRLKSLQIQP